MESSDYIIIAEMDADATEFYPTLIGNMDLLCKGREKVEAKP